MIVVVLLVVQETNKVLKVKKKKQNKKKNSSYQNSQLAYAFLNRVCLNRILSGHNIANRTIGLQKNKYIYFDISLLIILSERFIIN